MPGNLGSGIVGLRAETAEFNRRMLRAQRRIRSFGREARRAARSAALITAGLAFGSGALGATIRNLSNSAASLRELSIASGIAVPRLQELQRVFEADGLSAETFSKSIRQLQRNIGNAAQGDQEYLESFERLGVNLRTAAGDIRDTEDVLTSVVAKLGEVPPAMAAAFASDIFGRGGKEILTTIARIRDDTDFLNQELARQAELLPTLSTTAATELKAVSQAFTDAGNAAHTYGQILIASVGPEIVAGIEGALRAIKENAGQITSTLRLVATNVDLLIGAALTFAFRGLIVQVAAASYAVARFGAILAFGSGASIAKNVVAFSASLRGFGAALAVVGRNVGKTVAGVAALAIAISYANQVIQGNFLGFDDAISDVLDTLNSGYQRITDIIDGVDEDLPVIQIEAQADGSAITEIRAQIAEVTSEPHIVRVQAETFGLGEQVVQLENQRDLLLAAGDEAVRLAARQQFLGQVQKELSASYDQLARAQEKLAEGGPNLDPDQARNYKEEIDTLVARINQLNNITVDPNFNSNVIDQISELNRQIAEISGKRQAEISVDMTVDFGGSLETTREQLESELRLLEQAASGNISFGIAEQMRVEVNAAISELNTVRNRIAQNERLLNLKPDIQESARLNAELVRLRSLAASIEFNIQNPEVLQQAAGDVIRLKNEIQALQRQQEFARSAANSFTNALEGMATGALSGDDAVKGIIRSLANLVLQYTVLIPLAQSLAGAFSGIGFPAIGAAATGGFRSGLTLVGERGPELIDAGSGSYIYTNEQLANAVSGGGQPMIVNNNISIDSTDGPGVQRALAEALPALTDASVNRLMSESVRPGQVRQVLRGY